MLECGAKHPFAHQNVQQAPKIWSKYTQIRIVCFGKLITIKRALQICKSTIV